MPRIFDDVGLLLPLVRDDHLDNILPDFHQFHCFSAKRFVMDCAMQRYSFPSVFFQQPHQKSFASHHDLSAIR